jgi:hypothetical protein
MSHFCLIEAVEMEGFGGGGVIAPAFRDVQVAGVLDGRDDRGADSGQVGGPAAGPAGGSVLAERRIPDPAGRAGRPPLRPGHPGDPRRSDIDLWQREITVRGKGGKDRIVKIGHQTALNLDRYLRARARHAQAWRPQLWLGAGNREPLTAAGIYQMTARRGRQCGVDVYPHRFRHLQPHLAGPRRP